MSKNFNDFIATLDKKQLVNLFKAQTALYADENGCISQDKMASILALNSITSTMAILEKYHQWLHQN